jgi:hypothetical protein
MFLMRHFLLLDTQFILEAKNKVPGPIGGNGYPAGQGFLQLGRGGTRILRGREVVAQSIGTTHRHRTGHHDHSAGLCLQDFRVLEIDLDLFPHRHASSGLGLFSLGGET